MKKGRERRLDFEVDKLTSSIENTLTGEVFETEIVRLGEEQVPLLRKLKWLFKWSNELRDPTKEVYALITKGNPSVWHGLVSAEDRGDHWFMHLIESAPFNRGSDKLYEGVAGNLVAFLCKKSFERGYRGSLGFLSKTRLIEHYEKTLGAKRFSGHRLLIETREAYKLVKQYFPEFDT